MSNHRIERVGMEIKREVNEILQRRYVTHVFKVSLLLMSKCQVIYLWQRFTILS